MYGQHMAHIRLLIYCVLFWPYRLSHPVASCNICSLPSLISHQLLKSIWYLIAAIIVLLYLHEGPQSSELLTGF